jgi:hypothetical protein
MYIQTRVRAYRGVSPLLDHTEILVVLTECLLGR